MNKKIKQNEVYSMVLNNSIEIFNFKGEVYKYINPLDVKKLPIGDSYKEKILSLVQVPTSEENSQFIVDKKTVEVILESIRNFKICRKKFASEKANINEYYKNVIENFLNFESNAIDTYEKIKNYTSTNKHYDIEAERN